MKRIFTSIWLLAAVIALPLILLLPLPMKKYTLEEVSRETNSDQFKNVVVYYEDLDGDQKPEKIQVGKVTFWEKSRIAFIVHTDRPTVLFYGDDSAIPLLFFDDFDKDGQKEIFAFSYSGDSLFINKNALHDEDPHQRYKMKPYYVSFADSSNSPYGRAITKVLFDDRNSDGYDELIFAAQSYGEIKANILFTFDIHNETLSRSEILSDSYFNIQLFDLDNDGTKEIIADGSNPRIDQSNFYPLSDAAYLKILDSEMNFKLPPVRFKMGETATLPVRKNNTTSFFTLFNASMVENQSGMLYKLNSDGVIEDSVIVDVTRRVPFPSINLSRNGKLIVHAEVGKVYIYSTNLKLLETIPLGELGDRLIITDVHDIDGNGTREFLCYNFDNGSEFIYTDLFKYKLLVRDHQRDMIQIKHEIGNNLFYTFDNDYSYVHQFKKNPFYLLKFPIYALIYLLSLLLVILIRKTHESRLKEKYELQQQVHELQLKTFRNQLNPHFIFNTFNGVASVIKKGDTEKAYDVFMRFSKMTRNVLDNFDESIIPFGREIDLVQNYLELQKFRFKDLFEYQLEAEKKLNEIPVPRMIVQVHVENAIVHGIIPKGSGGLLKVEARMEESVFRITIEDNGIGRERSARLNKDSNGLGLKTIQSVIDEINIGRKYKIIQKIHDLNNDSGNAAGTRVEILIPVELTNKTAYNGR